MSSNQGDGVEPLARVELVVPVQEDAAAVIDAGIKLSEKAARVSILHRQGYGGQAVFINFLAYCLHVTLEQYSKKAATGLRSRSVLERMSEIQMPDVNVPATDGREVCMNRYTRPEKIHQHLLDQLGLILPAQPPPEIQSLWWRPFEKINASSKIQTSKTI